jgi:hypothetical protein
MLLFRFYNLVKSAISDHNDRFKLKFKIIFQDRQYIAQNCPQTIYFFGVKSTVITLIIFSIV